MDSGTPGRRTRECPQCGVKLTRYEWSRLWWMSGLMSGRLVQPCTECGTRLRMSSMTLVSSAASIGLIVTAGLFFVYRDSSEESQYARSVLLFIALALLLVVLVAMLATRIEAAPTATAGGAEPAKPDRIGKKRL
ncbi:MAG TPA: hypothetical protein VFV78_07665 [Vicinamibacterales bacterium]|nr:hypothetical protein [Vicinamibacterales bacterium]